MTMLAPPPTRYVISEDEVAIASSSGPSDDAGGPAVHLGAGVVGLDGAGEVLRAVPGEGRLYAVRSG